MRWLWWATGALAAAHALRRMTQSSIEIWSADSETRLVLALSSPADRAAAARVDRLLREYG